MLQIPLGGARALFVALFVLLLFWVLNLPRRYVTPPDRPAKPGENLKYWAALAVIIQIAIYMFL